jgi:hypothetical protein
MREHIDSGKKNSECGSFANMMKVRCKPDFSASGELVALWYLEQRMMEKPGVTLPARTKQRLYGM